MTAGARAALASAAPWERLDPVALPDAGQFEVAAADGRRYRVLVAVPPGPAPIGGFPVMVLADGHALFATAAATARLQAGRPEATGVSPCVVVGIGYPGEADFDAERRQQDLLPVPGGADRFLDLILGEILPAVGRLVPLDPARRVLVGHSYGGLFVLHALFTRPGLFAGHVAGSPSIWWGERAILRAEAAFRAMGGAAAARLLITVGGAEQSPPPGAGPERIARLAQARMVDNAREMVERLRGAGGSACRYAVIAEENHVSVIPGMLARAVSFALAEGASPP